MSKLCQPKEDKLRQIPSRGGSHPEQVFSSTRRSKRWYNLSYNSTQCSIAPHLHCTPQTLRGTSTSRDTGRDSQASRPPQKRPHLNCQDLIKASRNASAYIDGKKLRDFVETMVHKTNLTKLWRTIKGIDGSAKRTAGKEAITFNVVSFSSSKHLAARFNQQFNTVWVFCVESFAHVESYSDCSYRGCHLVKPICYSVI